MCAAQPFIGCVVVAFVVKYWREAAAQHHQRLIQPLQSVGGRGQGEGAQTRDQEEEEEDLVQLHEAGDVVLDEEKEDPPISEEDETSSYDMDYGSRYGSSYGEEVVSREGEIHGHGLVQKGREKGWMDGRKKEKR